MNDLDRWYEHTAGRHNRVVSLYSSFLTGRIFGYLRYRLRFPFMVSTVRFAVHVAEFFILLNALGGVATFTVMVLRAGSLIVAGGWWGLLEVMRDRLRAFARSGDRDAADEEIGRWMVLGVLAALAVIVVGGVTVLLASLPGVDPIGRFYAFLVIAELALGLPVQVLHAGIYATRRVYKPIWSMFVSTAVQLAVLGAGFFYYPAAAVVVAIIAANAIGIWITVRYCLEAYRMTGIRPRVPHGGFWHRLPRIPPLLGLETTLSGLSLRLDAVLVLALVGFYGTNTRTFDLTAGSTSWEHIDAFQFFYLILPLFRGTYESAGIFYFDFVRLRCNPALRPLALLFFRKLLWVAPVMALFYWLLAASLGRFVLHDVPISFLLALLPMFLARAVIGIYQIRLFAEGRYRAHLATLLLLIVLLWLVWIKPNPASDLVEITAAMLVQVIVLINIQHWQDRRDPPLPTLVTFGEWTQSLGAEPGPVTVGTVTVPEAITSKQKSATVRLMQETFEGNGYFAFRSATALVFYRRVTGGAGPAVHLELQTATGGAVRHGRSLSATSGHDAVNRLRSVSWLERLDDTAPNSPQTLTAEFRKLFAEGIAFDTETLAGAPDMRTLDANILARALPTAVASLEDGADAVTLEGLRLTPVFGRGMLRLLCVLPPDPDPGNLRAWRRMARAGCTSDA